MQTLRTHARGTLVGPVAAARGWWFRAWIDDAGTWQIFCPLSAPHEPASVRTIVSDRSNRPRPTESRIPQTDAVTRPIRAALVARVRRAIADGTYDTSERFECALDRLLGRLDAE